MGRIGQFIQSVDVTAGGTSTAFLNTLEALRTRAGLEWHAYASPPAEGDPARAIVAREPERWTCVSGYGRSLSAGALGRAVVGDVEAGEIDLLHLHGLWSPDLLAAARACLRRGVPYVWEPHGMLVREAYAQKRLKKEVFMALGMRRALRGASRLVFVTAEERDHSVVPAGVGVERREVVPLPVVMPEIEADAAYRRAARERFGVPAEVPCVVFMGRLHPVKRVEMVLRAAAELAGRGGAWGELRILLVGGGPEAYTRELRQLAAGLGLGERAIFAGWVRGDDRWRALAAGDVLTLNSLHENFGYVAVEALCVGTAPVVTSNLALAGEMKAAGVAEVAAPDERSLAGAWARAIGARGEAGRAERGRAWVRDHLSAEAVGARLEELYGGVGALKERAARP